MNGNPEIIFIRDSFFCRKKTTWFSWSFLLPAFVLFIWAWIERKTAGIWTTAFIDIARIQGSVWRILGLSSMACWWCGCLVWGFVDLSPKTERFFDFEAKKNRLFKVFGKQRLFQSFLLEKKPPNSNKIHQIFWGEISSETRSDPQFLGVGTFLGSKNPRRFRWPEILMIVEVWGVYVPWSLTKRPGVPPKMPLRFLWEGENLGKMHGKILSDLSTL